MQLSSQNIDCLHRGKLEISFLLTHPRLLAGCISGQEVWVSRDSTGEGCWLGQQREEAAGYVACKTTLVEVGSSLSGKSKTEAWLLWNLQGERYMPEHCSTQWSWV